MTAVPDTVPDGWQVVRLGEVAEVRSGTGFPIERQGRRSGAYPFIKVSDMNLGGNESYIRTANNCVDEADVSELGATVFAPGTVVFPKVGAAIATNKKRALIVPTIIDNNLVGITVSDAKRCDARFLHVWFESVSLEQFANVSAVPSITGSRLKRESIPLPPLPEQRAIAAILDGIDEAIERTEDVIAATERVRDALLHDLLTRGLPGRHSDWVDVPGLGTVPACWDVVRLREVTDDMVYGPRFPSDRYAPDGSIVTLRTTDISDRGAIDWTDAPTADLDIERFSRFLLRNGDIVVTRSGTCGIAAIFRGHDKPVLPGAFLIRMRALSVEPDWITLFLNSSIGRAQTQRAQSGGVQKNLNGPSLSALLLSCPPVDERRAIIRMLSTVDKATAASIQEVGSLLGEKEALTEALLNGRVRVSPSAREC